MTEVHTSEVRDYLVVFGEDEIIARKSPRIKNPAIIAEINMAN